MKPFAVLDLNNRSESIPLSPWLAASVIYPIPKISQIFPTSQCQKGHKRGSIHTTAKLDSGRPCFATMKNVINCSNVVSIPLEGDQVIDRMLTDQKGVNAPMRAASLLVLSASD